jgi:membrane protein GlpM
MSFALLLKASLGALVVVVMALLSRTKNYYLAGLVPMFPTFTIIAHYIIGTTRTNAELKTNLN